jgi:hypothetical protein
MPIGPPIRLLLFLSGFGLASGALAQGEVFPDPAKTYEGFKPHQLAFQVPTDGVARADFKSAPFYAIILKTAKPCSVTEPERLKAQAHFPGNKVFTTRFECEGEVEENITYTNVNPKFGFLAVYAGSTLAQARQFLSSVEATGQFPGANIRRMEVVLVYP